MNYMINFLRYIILGRDTVFTRLLAALDCEPQEVVLKINVSRL